jgi:penicillin-binding protein 2
MEAVSKGQAGRPIGTPLQASTMPWPPEQERTPAALRATP